MAQRIQTMLIDDLDGGEADETVTFAVDGVTYEIDLNQKNSAKFHKFIEPYTKAARRTGGRAARSKAKSKAADSSDTALIRAWAKDNGFDVNDRGRVPANIREAYEKARG